MAAAAMNLADKGIIRTTVRKKHAIPRRFLPKKNAKNSKRITYDDSSLHCNPALQSGKVAQFRGNPNTDDGGILTQSRKDAKAQRVFSFLASLRLRVFALRGPCFIGGIPACRSSILFGCGFPRCVLCGSIHFWLWQLPLPFSFITYPL
jgi:hypothetical protein